VRIDAVPDDRLPAKGPGRAASGNFVVTEFTARALSTTAPTKLVRNWDFSATDKDWQAEEGAKVVADSGMQHLFGNGQHLGLKAEVKAPAGSYVLDIVTGVRPTVAVTVQWTTANGATFNDARSAHRVLPAGNGGGLPTPIAIDADGELTGLRIGVDDEQSVLPIDAVRLFSSEGAAPTDIKLVGPKATFSQAGYAVKTAIDGNKGAETDNGWAIAPQFGREQSARFGLATPLESAKGRFVEFTIYQNFVDGNHKLGRFRLSITNSKQPLNFGLPATIGAILGKPADKRTDAERQALLAQERSEDKKYQELQAAVAAAQQSMASDNRLKELEAQLAAASQPLPIDPKLQQMRRAVELSEEQLKDRRLTVAQDVVWALINNPAFLYNH